MLNYLGVTKRLDKIATELENCGYIKEAREIDAVSDVIEAMANFPPQAIELARELGIRLTPETASKIVSEYYDPKMEKQLKQESKDVTKEAMQLSPKTKKFMLLAMYLANAFLSQVSAKNPDKPILVRLDQFEGRGRQEHIYTPRDLQMLKERDPKTYSIVMNAYYKQQAGKEYVQEIKQNQERRTKEMDIYKMPATMKKVKDRDLLRDEFGNTGTLITYEDGTKELLGDIIDRGQSLRTRLERAGEIKVDPNAERVNPSKY